MSRPQSYGQGAEVATSVLLLLRFAKRIPVDMQDNQAFVRREITQVSRKIQTVVARNGCSLVGPWLRNLFFLRVGNTCTG